MSRENVRTSIFCKLWVGLQVDYLEKSHTMTKGYIVDLGDSYRR